MANDNSIASALWLVAGGAAGYAAGRFVVAPLLAKRPPVASSTVASAPQAPKPRALGAGPSGAAMPVDPYGPKSLHVSPAQTGPSGEMRPIDPYGERSATGDGAG